MIVKPRSPQKIFLFGEATECEFVKKDAGLWESQPLDLKGLKCKGKINACIRVDKNSPHSIKLYFYSTEIEKELLYSPNPNNKKLRWKDLTKPKGDLGLNKGFHNWPKESADLFLCLTNEIFIENQSDFRGLYHLDMNSFLDFIRYLDWGADKKFLPEKQFHILARHALSRTQNSFLNSGSRYDYQYKFLGLNARDLASWCLATGRLPNERDLEHFPKKHSCSLSLGDTLVMEQ